MSEGKRNPQAFVLDENEIDVKPKARAPRITFATEEPAGELIVVPPATLPSARRIGWLSILVSALFTLFTLWAGLSISRLIEDFFARSTTMGWLVLGIAAVAGFAALAIIAREIWGLVRLSRIEHIQIDAAHALNTDDKLASERAVASLKSLYHGKADGAWGLKRLAEHAGDILDPRDRLRLAERYLVAPRDAEAHRIIARAARRVTLLTTVTPAAALDILFVAAQNFRMLRELATLYGGRPSTLATLRLARLVVAHLAVAGGLALSDNLLQHVVGRGVLGRLSARFGEGAVNGILTSRIGLAAVDVCRPVPLEASAKETVGSLLKELVNMSGPPEKSDG